MSELLTQSPVRETPALGISQSLLPLLILGLSMCAGFTVFVSFGIMAESAKAEMGLSDEMLGLIQGGSAAFRCCYSRFRSASWSTEPTAYAW